MTLCPDGYGTRLITFEQMVAKHSPLMHPEMVRRFFPYLASLGGRMGVGGGHRTAQPVGPTFAPAGASFHESHRFASGFVGYAAVDLVMAVPGRVHRAPTWAETADAPEWGLHTFIRSPQEPWHMQPIEMRGFATWVAAGRPDPPRRTLPGDVVIPPTIPEELPMKYYALPPNTTGNRAHIVVIDGSCRYRTNGDTEPLPEIRLPEEQYIQLRLSAGLGPG